MKTLRESKIKSIHQRRQGTPKYRLFLRETLCDLVDSCFPAMALRVFVSSALGLGLIVLLLTSIAFAGEVDSSRPHRTPSLSSASVANTADGLIRETDLTTDGDVYEINDDGRGNLWISEYSAGQIRQFNMATHVYTIYQNIHNVDDARRDSGDNVWWSHYDNGQLGRIDLSAGTVTTWTLPGAGFPWGTAIDAFDQVWVTDADAPTIYRFNLTTTQVCSYTLPGGGKSDYIIHDAGVLWVGDDANDRLVELDPAANTFTSYQLPFDSYPEGLAAGEDGNIWWGDYDNPFIGQLKPNSLQVVTYTLPYTLPDGEGPGMIDFSAGSIWYTVYTSGTFGAMNPAVATGVSSVITSATVAVTPSCAILGPGVTLPTSTVTGTASFTNAVYAPKIDSGGWTVYQLDLNSGLWPIRHVSGGVWIGDQSRDKLIWFSHRLYIPLVVKK
ncbi:MAG: hypothetical protein HC802_01680 [Caldilineaceae bacterium]|nr:hypothetical protein [Caldilineaceae bacterium]